MSTCDDDVITNSGSNIASVELDPDLLTESESFDPNNRHSPIGKPSSALDDKGTILLRNNLELRNKGEIEFDLEFKSIDQISIWLRIVIT